MSYSLTKEEAMINLDKLTREVSLLKKEMNIVGQEAEVWVVMDMSGSMSPLFRDGTVQKVVDRAMAVGMGFDANKQIDVAIFGSSAKYMGAVNENNFYGYADYLWNKQGQMGATYYASAINVIVEESFTEKTTSRKGGVLGLFSKKTVETKTIEVLEKPVYVLFFTDGDNHDKPATTQLIRDLSNKGIFFQFIGLGSSSFDYLEKLDNMSGRVLDNANFFQVRNIDDWTDHDILAKMMSEFAGWVPQARAKGFIK
ncbi:hypothetical protein M3_0104 [Lysinibacillus phage vB_LfM_LysYB1]|nr:hypothetical protein M3_0104 [Lysinibacillus phage vB_LfM_LysYB1]WAB25387.1 hypothetical protein M5_0209 [Lysinibacillus phage vB_LfM_LysYB2]